jgi:hypothetical protein
MVTESVRRKSELGCGAPVSRPHNLRAMAKSPRVRFTFVLRDARGTPLNCGGWRVWTNGEDTYITSKSLHDTWKVSLHGDSWWAASVTKENSLRPDTVLPPGEERSMWKFAPTAFQGGQRIAFAIGVFRHALLPVPLDDRETVIEVPDRWDALTLALVRMTEPGVEPDPEWHLVGGPLPLTSGRQVWVTDHYEEVGAMDPEPIASGAMIEPWTPEEHGVVSPGWIVKGVHIA